MSSNGNGLSNSIRVEIYDQSYNLRGPDPDYLFRLAEFVDIKMRTVATQTATVDSLLLANRVSDALRQPFRARADVGTCGVRGVETVRVV